MTTTSMPEVRRIKEAVDLSKDLQWLREHRQEYIGKWVVLEDGRLVGAGDDPAPIVAKAREEGAKALFVEFVRDETQPYMGGWL
jgi:hypothetical protein